MKSTTIIEFKRIDIGYHVSIWVSNDIVIAFETPESDLICYKDDSSFSGHDHIDQLEPNKDKRFFERYTFEESYTKFITNKLYQPSKMF